MEKTKFKSFDIATLDIELEYNSKIAPIKAGIEKLNKNYEAKSLKAYKDFLSKENQSKEKLALLIDKAILRDQRIEKAVENKLVKLRTKEDRFNKEYEEYKAIQEAEFNIKFAEIDEIIKKLETSKNVDINDIKHKYDLNVKSYVEKLNTYNDNHDNNNLIHNQQVIEYDKLLITKLAEISEMKNYLDNQLTFSIEDDTSSITIQALISDKITQLDRFKKHLLSQEEKVKEILNNEYLDLYNKTLDRLLKRKGNDLVEDIRFFNEPDKYIFKLKQEIVEAKENDFVSLKDIITKYNKAIKYKNERVDCEKRAKQLTKNFLKQKRDVYLEYQKDSRNLVFQLEKYYRLYLELLKIDPFLAQIIGDNSTKIIKDELNFLSILQVNKEHKINVNFDIKTLKLKQQINQVEAKLAYESEKLMVEQDVELLNTIKDLLLYFADHQYDTALIMNSLTKEKYQIERLEKVINHHMDYQVKETNLNRKFLSMVTQILESGIRIEESHNIKVIDASSKIRLALKEYDILALHFNTMYENEKRFLVMQSNRVSEESKINNEFILTTFSNQMRFAGEQISLANDEYKLRVEAIMTAINEERNYYFDIIENRLQKYRKREKSISDEYQAKLYHDSFLLIEATEKTYKRALEKQIVLNKDSHDDQIAAIEEEIGRDESISESKRRLSELDQHFEVALDDAKIIRDDTVNEMTTLYYDAENKYNALKPYLNDKINPLDPTFFNSLEKMKKRHSSKLKVAEAELEVATKDLMDNYLKVFFEEKPEINSELYLSQIEQLEEERSIYEEEYSNKLQKSELVYHTQVKTLETELKNIISKVNADKDQLQNRHNKTVNQKQSDLVSLKKHFDTKSEKITSSYRGDVLELTNEYNQSLIQNEKHFINLTKAFDSILDSYYPYLRTASNNRVIKKIVKQTEKKMKHLQSLENKQLVKLSKDNNYLTE